MQCPRCRAEVDPQVKFCPECGASLASDEATVAGRLRNAAESKRGGVDEERPLWQGGFSAKGMVGVWVLLVVVSVVAIVATVLLVGAGTLGVGLPVALPVVLAVLGVLWLIGAAMLLYRRASIHYELTSQRLVHRHGILSRTTDRIELIDVDDIQYTQGLIERMLGVGTIIVQSSDVSHPHLQLYGIDRVQNVADTIDDARREERRRRGLHIETV